MDDPFHRLYGKKRYHESVVHVFNQEGVASSMNAIGGYVSPRLITS